MDTGLSQRFASLIEEILDSRVGLDGQNAKVEYVFYPIARTNPITHRWEFHGNVYPRPGDPPPTRRLPDCRLNAIAQGIAPKDGQEGEKFGLVDVYFSGNEKAVERLKYLTAVVGRFIPSDWVHDLDGYVVQEELARERARVLARFWFFCAPATVTEETDYDLQRTYFDVLGMYGNDGRSNETPVSIAPRFDGTRQEICAEINQADAEEPRPARPTPKAETYHVGVIEDAFAVLALVLSDFSEPSSSKEGVKPKLVDTEAAWWREGPPPVGWHQESLTGNQKQLCEWLQIKDEETLHKLCLEGETIWVEKEHRTQYHLFFRHKARFDSAKRRRDMAADLQIR